MVKVIVIVKGSDGEPDMIEMDGLEDETVIVNMIDGKIKLVAKEKPTVLCNVCGEAVGPGSMVDHTACVGVLLTPKQPLGSACGGFGQNPPMTIGGAYMGGASGLTASFAASSQEAAQRLHVELNASVGAIKALDQALDEASKFLAAERPAVDHA